MATTTIALNAAASVSIPAGSMLYVTGQGIVTYDNTFVIRGPRAIQGNTTFGPYDRVVTLSLSATNSALSYYSTTGPINSRGDLVLTGSADASGLRDPVPQVLANAQLGSSDMARVIAKFKGRTPGRIGTGGTSWGNGTGASSINVTSYRGLLEARYAGTLSAVNFAQGSSSMEAQVTLPFLQANATKPWGPGDILNIEVGFNDYNTGDGSPKHHAFLQRVWHSTLAMLCAPGASSANCQKITAYDASNPTAKVPNPGVQFSGTPTVGFGTGSAQYRMTFGAQATYTGSGDMIYIICWRGPGTTAALGTITVDGKAYTTDNARGTYAITSFVPFLMRIPVRPGNHTVVVDSNTFHSEVIFFTRGQVQAQTVLVMPCVDVRLDARVDNGNTVTSTAILASQVTALNSAGQVTPTPTNLANILGPTNGWMMDEGLIERLQRLARKAVQVMAYDGWEIALVENGNWEPIYHTAAPGSGASPVYHPNDLGHYALYEPLADAYDRVLGLK